MARLNRLLYFINLKALHLILLHKVYSHLYNSNLFSCNDTCRYLHSMKCLVGKLAIVHGGHFWEESRQEVWKKTFIFSYVCLYFMNFCTVGLIHLLHKLFKLKDGGEVEAWRGWAGQQGELRREVERAPQTRVRAHPFHTEQCQHHGRVGN